MKSKIILTIKDDGTYKARWVACGYSQIHGQDYDETFSPTANFKSILTLLHVAAVKDDHLYTVDIGNAFLESTLDRPLYMAPPKDLCTYLNINDKPLLITKGLYGLKQAGKLWFDLLKDLLLTYGFIQSIYDPCIFIYTKDESQIRVAVHVDDLLITGNHSKQMDDFIIYLETKLQKVKCNRNTSHFTYLGIDIQRDKANKYMTLSQYNHIKKVLNKYLPDDIPTSSYPLDSSLLEDPPTGPPHEPIYDTMGMLRYLADRTRSDLLYPINYLSRFMHNPSDRVVQETVRLLRYLKETQDYVLVIGGNDIYLYAMTDSSFIHTGKCRSQLGYAVYLSIHSGAVSTYSRRADSVALSSTQTEADGLVEAIKEILWFQGFLNSLNITIPLPTLILVDNRPVVSLAAEGNHLKKSKHFIIKTAYIKQERQRGNINIQHIKGVHNHADILTKPLTGYLLYLHTSGLLGHFLLHDILHDLTTVASQARTRK
jgi:hypothetical protein